MTAEILRLVTFTAHLFSARIVFDNSSHKSGLIDCRKTCGGEWYPKRLESGNFPRWTCSENRITGVKYVRASNERLLSLRGIFGAFLILSNIHKKNRLGEEAAAGGNHKG
jgi:hypothetical protein